MGHNLARNAAVIAKQSLVGGVLGATLGFADGIIATEDFEAASQMAAVAGAMGSILGAAMGGLGVIAKLFNACRAFAIGTIGLQLDFTIAGLVDAMEQNNLPLFIFRSVTGLAFLYLAIRASAACFPAGTKVRTPTGFVNIEDLRVGDLVVSRPESLPSSPNSPKRVAFLFQKSDEILEIHFQDGILRTTPSHPLFAQNIGWLAANELKPGYKVSTEFGNWAEVQRIVETNENTVVYGMSVEDFGTYFVGPEGMREDSIWVHNWCRPIEGAGTDFSRPIPTEQDNILAALAEAEANKYLNKGTGPVTGFLGLKNGQVVTRGGGVARGDKGSASMLANFVRTPLGKSLDKISRWFLENPHCESKGFARGMIAGPEVDEYVFYTKRSPEGVCSDICNPNLHELVRTTKVPTRVFEENGAGWILAKITPKEGG